MTRSTLLSLAFAVLAPTVVLAADMQNEAPAAKPVHTKTVARSGKKVTVSKVKATAPTAETK